MASPDSQLGLRFSWTLWPPSRQALAEREVPLGCLYTPLISHPSIPCVQYEPLRCHVSGALLNPYCSVDIRNKTWTCPFSGATNKFPDHYSERIAENLPREILSPTIEYILSDRIGYTGASIESNFGGGRNTELTGGSPALVFVVETCLHESELDSLKDSLQQALSLIPQDSRVGLVTYGTMCHVHELGFSECAKSYVFLGHEVLGDSTVQKRLGIAARNDPRGAASHAAIRRFMLPVTQCEFMLNSIIEDLQKDVWPVPAGQRPKRCTGVALMAAISLLECCCGQQSGRVMLFVGGPCTIGPGQVVDIALSESIRHHLDLQKDNNVARYVKKALKYYTELANRAVLNGHAIDIFSCSLDQVGLYEMRVCCEKTGGLMVLSDSFNTSVFKDSLKKLFEVDKSGYLQHGYNAKLEVRCSSGFKVCGAIGACSSTNKKGTQVADTQVGEGNTCEWAIGALDKRTTYSFYFEVTNQNSNTLPNAKQSYLQFQTLYHHPSGRRHLRVTTTSYSYASPQSLSVDLSPGFDQEASAVLMARLAVLKTENEDPHGVVNWLDRKLIRLVSHFADFQKDNADSFHLSQEFQIYPQFMYHLRRSHFLQIFNASPDETAFYRTSLLRENVLNSLVMIQPALLEYSFNKAHPEPVLLDSQSLKPDVILLLDSFFHVIIWHGEWIHDWKEAGYDNMPEHSNFKELLKAAADDAQEIVDERFPVPRLVLCYAGSSQARYLLAKVNPSLKYNAEVSNYGALSDECLIRTDDVSMKVFMEHLIKLAVKS